MDPSSSTSPPPPRDRNLDHAASMESETIRRLRDAASSPTPLAQFLGDPEVLKILTKRKARRATSSTSLRSPPPPSKHRKDRLPFVDHDDSIMGLMLAEEDRTANNLKGLLRNTTDRLEVELRRAEQAEMKAKASESRATVALARISISDSARQRSEQEASSLLMETKRLQALLDSTNLTLRRTEDLLRKSEAKRMAAEKEAEKYEDQARKYKSALKEYENALYEESEKRESTQRTASARGYHEGRKRGFEEGLEEGWRDGKEDGWQEGHGDGFQEGRFEGYEEGREVGRREGWEEGREAGKREERGQALKAFDKFVEEEMQPGHGPDKNDRTQQWVESYSNPSEHQPTPQRRPIWLHRRLNTEPPPQSHGAYAAAPPPTQQAYAPAPPGQPQQAYTQQQY